LIKQYQKLTFYWDRAIR